MSNQTFEDFYQSLNPAQKEAVDTIDGPVLVVAGPGVGKTQILSTRVANILRQTDTRPEEILCLTFTDKASFNMTQRLSQIIGLEAHRINVFTFHSLATEIISQNPEYFFGGISYRPADEILEIEILEKIFKDLAYDDPLASFHPDHGWTYLKDAKNGIKHLKESGLTPEEFDQILETEQEFLRIWEPEFQEIFGERADQKKASEKLSPILEKIRASQKTGNKTYLSEKLLIEDLERAVSGDFKLTDFKKYWFSPNAQKKQQFKEILNYPKLKSLGLIYQKYQQEMHKNKLFDFQDMLLEVTQTLKNKPELRYKYQEQFLYILVDEFQDTNAVQMSLISLLLNMDVSENRPNILAVGDDDQAIFKFQKATLANILDFEGNYRDVKIITLTENYRSTQEILDFSRQIIEQAELRLSTLKDLPKILHSFR